MDTVKISSYVENVRYIDLSDEKQRKTKKENEIFFELYNQITKKYNYGFFTPKEYLNTLLKMHISLDNKENMHTFILCCAKEILITVHDGNNIGYYQLSSDIIDFNYTFDQNIPIFQYNYYHSKIKCIKVNAKWFNVIIENEDSYFIDYNNRGRLDVVSKQSVLEDQTYILNLSKRSDIQNTILYTDNLNKDMQRSILNYLINVRLVNPTKEQINKKMYYVKKLKTKKSTLKNINFKTLKNPFILTKEGKIEYQPLNSFNSEIILIIKKLYSKG